MANLNIDNPLGPILLDIANAIREKKSTTDPIFPNDYADEILSIVSGGGSIDFEMGESMTPTDTITATYTVQNDYERCFVIFSAVRNYDATSSTVLKRNGVDLPVIFARDFRYIASVNISAVYGMSEVISLSAGDTLVYSYNNRNACQHCITIVKVRDNKPLVTDYREMIVKYDITRTEVMGLQNYTHTLATGTSGTVTATSQFFSTIEQSAPSGSDFRSKFTVKNKCILDIHMFDSGVFYYNNVITTPTENFHMNAGDTFILKNAYSNAMTFMIFAKDSE